MGTGTPPEEPTDLQEKRVAELWGTALAQKPLEMYGLYRDYIKHEDELINRRLSWNLTIQGLLFASYGLTVKEEVLLQKAHALLWVYPIVGMVVGLLAFLSIFGAQRAIDGVKRQWEKRVPKGVEQLFPELTGGGRKGAKLLGWVAQLLIPSAIVGAWVALLIFVSKRL